MSKFNMDEFLEIISKAKEIGAKSVSIGGVTVNFEDAEESSQTQEPEEKKDWFFKTKKTKNSSREDHREECDVCGSNFIQGDFGPYCRPCYLKRKEKRFKERGSW